MSSLSEPRRKVQLANIIQILKEKLKLATTYLDDGRPRNKGSLPDITAADVEPLAEDEMEDADVE